MRLFIPIPSRFVVPLVGVGFFAAGVFAAYGGLEIWQEQQRFQAEGVQAQGTVVSKSLEQATRQGNPRTNYLISYRFSSADGQTVEQTGEVSLDEWERLDEGSPITVTYLPSDPHTARTGAGSGWWLPLIFVAVGGLFAFIGAALGLPELLLALRWLRLSRRGLAAEGTVLKVWAIGIVNGMQQWQLSYEFRDHVGRMQQGESDLLSPDEAAAWEPGNKGAVRFDRERPQDSVWIGRAP